MSAASPRDIYQSVTLSTSLLRSWKYDRNRGKILEFGKDEEIALHIVHIEDHRDAPAAPQPPGAEALERPRMGTVHTCCFSKDDESARNVGAPKPHGRPSHRVMILRVASGADTSNAR